MYNVRKRYCCQKTVLSNFVKINLTCYLSKPHPCCQKTFTFCLLTKHLKFYHQTSRQKGKTFQHHNGRQSIITEATHVDSLPLSLDSGTVMLVPHPSIMHVLKKKQKDGEESIYSTSEPTAVIEKIDFSGRKKSSST